MVGLILCSGLVLFFVVLYFGFYEDMEIYGVFIDYIGDDIFIVISGIFIIVSIKEMFVVFVSHRLTYRREVLKKVWIFYNKAKLDLINELFVQHEERLNCKKNCQIILNDVFIDVFDVIFFNYLETYDFIKLFEIENFLVSGGVEVSGIVACSELEWFLEILNEYRNSGDIFSDESPYKFAVDLLVL